MKNKIKQGSIALIISIVLTLTACATIVGNETQLISVSSAPMGADIDIADETGAVIFNGKTPTTVTLNKSTGKYWGGKDYTVKITLDGYQTQTVAITHHPNGWYIAGNIIFGGLIGWFVVDPFSGKMYNLSPEAVNATLTNNKSSLNSYSPDSIRITLISDVPENLRGELVQIN
jgi:hypothetical protein